MVVIQTDRWKMKQQLKKSKRSNIHKPKDRKTQSNFAAIIKQMLPQKHIKTMTPNETWKTVEMTCKETSKKKLGVKDINNKPSEFREIQILSSKQNKLSDELESTKNKGKRK